MGTRIKAWHWKGSLARFLRSVAVAAACAIGIGALLFASITPKGEIGLTSEATAAHADDGYHSAQFPSPLGVAERHIEAHQAAVESILDFLGEAAVWGSTGLRLEAGDSQSEAAGTVGSILDFLAGAAVWSSTGLRLEAGDGQSEAATTVGSVLDFLAEAAVWSSTGLRLEAGDGQSA